MVSFPRTFSVPPVFALREVPLVWVIDRLEGDWAVCENARRQTRDVPLVELPAGAKPGDVLRHGKDGYRLDPSETLRRQKEVEALTKDLWA